MTCLGRIQERIDNEPPSSAGCDGRGSSRRSEQSGFPAAATISQYRLDHRRAHRTARCLCITLVLPGTDDDIEQATKQLYKLLEVLKVTDVTDLAAVSHEMALIKVSAKAQHRQEILLIAQMYNARVIDASPNTLLLEMTGPEDQVDSLLTMLRSFGIRELVRTGAIAMTRGSSQISGKGLHSSVADAVAVGAN
ncbi:MAG: acetolactate synthase small subunit [Thermomicrobiales bacterium]